MELTRSRAAGFSIVEVLIAAVIVLVIALGIVPLFTQAMAANVSGNDSTQVSNFARSRAEQFYQLEFNHPDLTIDAGNVKTFDDYYSAATRTWVVGAPTAGDPALWLRTTNIRQYSVEAITDDPVDDRVLQLAEALPGDADPGTVHFKEIEVLVESTREAGVLGPGRRIAVRLLKTQ